MKSREELIKEILERLDAIEERLNRIIGETEEVKTLVIDREYINRKNKERRERWRG